jgi:hypothetical protein
MTVWTGRAEGLFGLGHSPGGFRTWWRRLPGGSDDRLDDTHLIRMAGRFARRVKAWAAANQVPLLYCTAGQHKDGHYRDRVSCGGLGARGAASGPAAGAALPTSPCVGLGYPVTARAPDSGVMSG